jgi:CBS-domain-containing membrane protein
MTPAFKSLELKRLNRRLEYHQSLNRTDAVTMTSAASRVMTDLYRTGAVTVGAHDSLQQANSHMIVNGVRMLLVTDEENKVTGLITATDIMGEKPLHYVNQNGGNYSDVQVGDIMTRFDELEVLCWADVENARVGDIAETLKRVGRQHAIVVDGEIDAQKIRGIFSSSQIARETGEEVDTSSRAGNFAELEQALMHDVA